MADLSRIPEKSNCHDSDYSADVSKSHRVGNNAQVPTVSSYRTYAEVIVIVVLAVLVWYVLKFGMRKEEKAPPQVAFTVLLSKTTTLGQGQIVKYDKILTNIGECYNKSTGHFKVKYNCLYTISCTLMNSDRTIAHLRIVRNGMALSELYGFQGDHSQGSQTLHVCLNKSDHIWVENPGYTDANTILHDDHGGIFNVFSGILSALKCTE